MLLKLWQVKGKIAGCGPIFDNLENAIAEAKMLLDAE